MKKTGQPNQMPFKMMIVALAVVLMLPLSGYMLRQRLLYDFDDVPETVEVEGETY